MSTSSVTTLPKVELKKSLYFLTYPPTSITCQGQRLDDLFLHAPGNKSYTAKVQETTVRKAVYYEPHVNITFY
jgi:hypothetical protein